MLLFWLTWAFDKLLIWYIRLDTRERTLLQHHMKVIRINHLTITDLITGLWLN